MAILHRVRDFVGAIPRASARREAHRYLTHTRDCRGTQHRVLSELMALNAGSALSLDYKLDAHTNAAQFRDRFPVSNFERFRPYIERMKVGEFTALLGRHNELMMFSLSSGTTAKSKYIPITPRFLKDYRRGWNVWGIHALDAHRTLNRCNILQIISDFDRFRTPAGTPCGNISGLVAAVQKPIVRTMFTLPREVSKLPGFDAKYYCTVRMAICDPTIGMVTTANPSTLIHLAKLVEENAESLIRDIADGRVPEAYAPPPHLLGKLGPMLYRRNRSRAQQLDEIANRTGRLYPQDIWKDLSLLAVWTGGSAGSYLPTLRRYYGDTPVRDHGLSASEGRMTIPLEDGTAGGVLDIGSHYFEFIPEREYECTTNPVVLEAHELEEGENYYILLTTASGLYRYDICDVVHCSGFYGTTPVLEFLHKGAHISNLTGEKISESQVVQAVGKAAGELNIEVQQFTLTPVWGDPPHYRLLVEGGSIPEGAGASLAAATETALRTLNCEYDEKRDSGRLEPINYEPVPKGTWEQIVKGCQERVGGSVEQYKHPCLVPDLSFREKRLPQIIANVDPTALLTTPVREA